MPNWAALNGVLFVFKTGIRWNHLTTQLGFGSGENCWRRLRNWREVHVWERLYELLLAKRRAARRNRFLACRRRLIIGTGRLGLTQNWAEPRRSRAPQFQA
ncbi:transposase [Burkholderia sp. Bp8986]|nr:transposase [Burkholderia sp. Bp8986]